LEAVAANKKIFEWFPDIHMIKNYIGNRNFKQEEAGELCQKLLEKTPEDVLLFYLKIDSFRFRFP
jgi:hypothetical protein